MEDEFEGINDIKELFNQILGSEVTIKDNLDATEEGVFLVFINIFTILGYFENYKITFSNYQIKIATILKLRNF